MRLGRPDWDTYWMVVAHVIATRATCDRGPELRCDPGRHGTGAVLVKDNIILATGYNGAPPGMPHCDDLTCSRCGKKQPLGDFKPGTPCPSCTSLDEASSIARMARQVAFGEEPVQPVLVGDHEMEDGHCVRTIHSEENAILQCASTGIQVAGATLYVTTKPCYHCMKRVIRVGIARVVYEFDYGEDPRPNTLAQQAGVEMNMWRLPDGAKL